MRGLLPAWLAKLAEQSGERLLPDIPHRFTREIPWPGCWCGEPADDPVHQAGGAR